MKTLMIIALATFAECAVAIPSSNNFHAVTNDWYNGNFTNVYELAQLRFAANSNDVVGVYLKVAFDIYHSDMQVLTGDMTRVVAVSDLVTNPAFTNVYHVLRPHYIFYRDEFIPSVTESGRLGEQAKSRSARKPIPGCYILQILWDNGLWGAQ